jgi:hypothetical protein
MDEYVANWRNRGLCMQSPEPWTSERLSEKVMAKHLCLEHCPVLPQCVEDTERYNYRGVVAGGMIWSDTPGIALTYPRRNLGICTRCNPVLEKVAA